MKRNKSKPARTWKLILRSLENNIPVVLLYVVHSHGSSPGREGFFMAVNAAGKMRGSIGGGIMEHKLIELSKEIIASGNHQILVKRQVHEKSAAKDQSGMICSGEQTIVVYPVQYVEKEVILNIVNCLEGYGHGILRLKPNGISFHTASEDVRVIEGFHFKTMLDWWYAGHIGFRDHLYIAGGGHCSLALCKLFSGFPFYIHVFDDRESLPTLTNNKWAHEVVFLKEGYPEISTRVTAGANSYLVVMTEGYRTDDVVLKSTMHLSFRYLGVLGSTAKIQKMFDSYLAQGIRREVLDKIHAPIGIAIRSKTPEEIAVSTAAEIIKVKNEVE